MKNFKRVLKAGFLSFWRNGIVSFASVLVMVITLLIIGSIMFGMTLLNSSLSLVKDRVDINIFFKTNATEEEIFALKDKIIKLPEVRLVDYISKEEALSDFKERHKNNSLIISSLDELDENPLGASLNIKAKETSQYESIAKFLESDEVLSLSGESVIDKVNFLENKIIIDKLTSFINATEKLGLVVSVLFILVAIVVTFNTVRLAIFTSKEEIAVMRLVGASNWYIRGPFIVCGMISGIISAIISMVIFYPVNLWLGPTTEKFFGGTNLFVYYIDNFFVIFLVLLLVGILLGALASFLAVRKYLRV